MGVRKRASPVRRTKRAVKAGALVGALLVGAELMARAGASPDQAWLGWFALVPLFLAIRLWRPAACMSAGALWGFSLYVFSLGQADAAVSPAVGSLLLLTLIPAAYASVGAWVTRRIGFNPFILGFGWMGVELALEPAGLAAGLLGAARGNGTLLDWLGGALGYVLVAFVIALGTASLVSVLSAARLRIPQHRCAAPSPDRGAWVTSQTFSCFPLFAIHPPRPRAPPVLQ